MILDTLLAKGNLSKMTITALEPAPVDSPPVVSTEKDNTFTVLVNPTSYRITYSTNFNQQKKQGDPAPELQFVNSEPATIDFEVLFDGTGVIPKQPSGNSLEGIPVAGAIAGGIAGLAVKKNEDTVAKQLIKFTNLVYEYKGDEHQPKRVQIKWGTLVFYGRLKSLSYQFKLFAPDGTPLRVVAAVSFESHTLDFLRAALDKTSSPDLTHVRTVQEGDTLPLMCSRIYGSPDPYLEVARANNLLNFRKLDVGTQLFFPPFA